MPTKSRTYGTQSVRSPLVVINTFESNGTPHLFGNSRTASCTRRIGREESITTLSGVDGGFRPCTHSINEWITNGSSTISGPLTSSKAWNGAWKIAGTSVTGLQAQVHANRYATLLSTVSSQLPTLSSVQWNALRAEALSTMLPSFSGDLSIANAILELKDFRDIGNRIYERGTRNMRNITRSNGGPPETNSEDDVKRLRRLLGIKPENDGKPPRTNLENDVRQLRRGNPVKGASGLYLQYMFGWRPFINDVVELYRICSTIDERIRELVRRANSPQQRYYGRWIEGSSTSYTTLVSGEDSPLGGSSGDFIPRVKWEVVCPASPGIRFHATMRYRYPVPPELTQAGGRAKALLDALGINGNWSMLWNAIPYSFVLDWFVKVNRFLSRLRVDNIPIKTEISDFCASAKVIKSFQFVLTDRNQLSNGTYVYGGKRVTDFVKTTRYERKKGIPDLYSSILLSGLNPTEFSLAGALVGSRIKPKRTRQTNTVS